MVVDGQVGSSEALQDQLGGEVPLYFTPKIQAITTTLYHPPPHCITHRHTVSPTTTQYLHWVAVKSSTNSSVLKVKWQSKSSGETQVMIPLSQCLYYWLFFFFCEGSVQIVMRV